jgi:hypothetical protein
MLKGACQCGAVKYEITAPPLLMYHCHCGRCRAASGASYATNIIVPTEAFTIVAGKDRLSSFESSPQKHRYFCVACGSPIYSHGQKTKDCVSVRCGTLQDDPGIRPAYHAYVASKAKWVEIREEIPQVPEGVGQ